MDGEHFQSDVTASSILLAIGEMRGQGSAMMAQLTAMNNEIVRMRAEVDGKHEINQRSIADTQKELVERLDAHRGEVNDKIDRVNRYIWMVQGIAALMSAGAVIISLLTALGWQPLANPGGYSYSAPSTGPLDPYRNDPVKKPSADLLER